MKGSYKKIIAMVMVLAMLFAVTACGNKTEETAGDAAEGEATEETTEEAAEETAEMGETMAKIKESGKIIMGVNATYAPFEFHKDINGVDTIIGFDIDLGHAIADELGVELEVVDMDFDGLLPALATGKVDFLPGLAWTEERAQNASFTIPYHKSVQIVVMQNADAEATKADDTLDGKTIGILKGSVQETTFPARYPNATLEPLGNVSDLIASLKSGRVDGVIMDYVTATLYDAANDDIAVSQISYELTDEEDSGSCVLLRKDNNEDIIEVMNGVLERVMSNGELEAWEEEAIAQMELPTE